MVALYVASLCLIRGNSVNIRLTDRDEALESFSEKLRLMLTFEGDPAAADYLLDEWPESLPHLAHTPNPTIPVFVVSAVAAHPQALQGAGVGQTGA